MAIGRGIHRRTILRVCKKGKKNFTFKINVLALRQRKKKLQIFKLSDKSLILYTVFVLFFFFLFSWNLNKVLHRFYIILLYSSNEIFVAERESANGHQCTYIAIVIYLDFV